ncbi:MAG: c-type cytochrome [Bacteroidia bacterium]
MDTGILHTHHLLAVLLIVLIGVPIVFAQWAKAVRKVHMVLDSLLVLTGIYLLTKAPAAFSSPYLAKYLLTLIAVGLAVVGNRRNDKRLSVAAFVLLSYVYGLSLQRDFLLRSEEKQVAAIATQVISAEEGQKLYTILCSRCHGEDGQAQYRKSPSLHPIQNPDTNYWAAVIRNGKGMMPPHSYLSDRQVSSLIAFLRSWQ